MSKQIEALKLALEAIEKLWGIIDDIDTYGDMAKADEKLYRSLVERRQRTRFEETGISTDGYTLNGGAITAIREALAEQPAQGCDYCNHPQYAGTKCKNCGREKPAQQREPVAWMKDCADFWEHYTYISEASQENYKAEAQMWVEKLRTSPPASKPWVGLTTEDRVEILRARGEASVLHLTEAKLREKNNG